MIAEAGLPVTPVEQVTGFPECLDGRVKTLHPGVHAGLLADLRLESHRDQLADLGIAPFDLLVSNLYPFGDTVASGATPDECVEQIDIGGPSMVRSAAKNHASVAVVTSPAQYPALRAALESGGFTLAERQGLAAAAFAHTAAYDVAVAGWLRQEVAEPRRAVPDLDRRDLPADRRCSATARTRTSGRRSTDRGRRTRARHRASSCTARRCPTTTTSTPTPPGGRRTTSTSRRWRSSSTPTRAASRSAPTSPRPTAGPTPATRCRPSAA